MGIYRKIEVKIWSDAKFMQLSKLQPSGQALFLYLLTGPHTGIVPGLFRAGYAAMAEDLGWDIDAFRFAIGEAKALGIVLADPEAKLVWIPNAVKYNPPTSINIIKGWAKAVETLPQCTLLTTAIEHIREYLHSFGRQGNSLAAAFDESFGYPKPSARLSPKPLAKPSPRAFQEQEQEQEQEQNLSSHSKFTVTGNAPGADAPSVEKSLVVVEENDPSGADLVRDLMTSFKSKAPITDWKRQATAAKHVAYKIALSSEGMDCRDFARGVVETFWSLTNGEDRFWRRKPFQLSVLNGLFDQVVAEMQAGTARAPSTAWVQDGLRRTRVVSEVMS